MQNNAARSAAPTQLNKTRADLAAIMSAARATSTDLQDVISSVSPATSIAQLAASRGAESSAAACADAGIDQHLHGLLSWTRRAMDLLKDATAEHVRCLNYICAKVLQLIAVRRSVTRMEGLIYSEAHPVAGQAHLREAEQASVAEARSLREHLSVVQLALHHQQEAATAALRCCRTSSHEPGIQ
jgi:hypothetical protein